MNDSDAAFKQQLEKLKHGGELQLECCGLILRVSLAHSMFIILVETLVSPDRFYDFIQRQQEDMWTNEQYLLCGRKVHYCLLVDNMDFGTIINCAYSVVSRSQAYQ